MPPRPGHTGPARCDPPGQSNSREAGQLHTYFITIKRPEPPRTVLGGRDGTCQPFLGLPPAPRNRCRDFRSSLPGPGRGLDPGGEIWGPRRLPRREARTHANLALRPLHPPPPSPGSPEGRELEAGSAGWGRGQAAGSAPLLAAGPGLAGGRHGPGPPPWPCPQPAALLT